MIRARPAALQRSPYPAVNAANSPCSRFRRITPETPRPPRSLRSTGPQFSMVLGLGTVLPARPSRRQPPLPLPGSQLALVQSNSLPAALQQPAGAAAGVAAAGWPVGQPAAGGSKSQAVAVDTPTSHPCLPQPARSDQSNVNAPRGAPLPEPLRLEPPAHVQQQQAQSVEPPEQRQEQQSQQEQGAASVAPALPARDQGPAQGNRERQSTVRQQDGEAKPAAAARQRQRKPAAKPNATPELNTAPAAHTRRPQKRANESAAKGRGKRRADSSEAEATPAGKRRRGVRAQPDATLSKHSPSKYADILQRTVVVPGKIFFEKDPKAVFIGRVNKLEGRRKVPAVEMQFVDDMQKYWFPVADVRDWVAAMVRNGSWDKHNPGVPPPAPPPPPGAPATEDTQAAQALRSLSASRCTSGGGDETLSAAQPTTSTGRQPRAESARQLQRAGSELKRKGALDIMVQAADL